MTHLLSLALGATLLPSPDPVDGKIVAASLFKNGYAVVVREADLGSGGMVTVRPPANAVLGTLWVSSAPGVKLQRVLATQVESTSQRDANSLDEVITANFEKVVVIETTPVTPGQSSVVKGRIVSTAGSIVVVEGEGNVRVALQKASVVRISAPEHGLNFRLPSTTSQNVLQISGEGTGKVYWVSLQRGMTWAPGYQLDVSDDKQARLIGKATILNDLADLQGISVNLVTGFPNMRFLGALDPLTSGYTVDQFVQNLAFAATDTRYRREAMMQNQAPGSAGGFGGPGGEDMTPTGSGTQLEDLFFYKQPSVTLKNGERGYFAVLEGKSDYRQEYSLEVPDTDWNNLQPAFGKSEDVPLDVWHTVIFKNATGQPLTTGPILTVKNGEVLGQDLLKYTSPGSEATVKVTKALDIRAENLDEEISRERGALRIRDNVVFDRVKVKGTIQITNGKDKAVQMLVKRAAMGEVTEPGGAAVVKTPAGLRQVNPTSELTWKPTLKAGEKLVLTYQIQIYVPTAGY